MAINNRTVQIGVMYKGVPSFVISNDVKVIIELKKHTTKIRTSGVTITCIIEN
jgi:hypothetical protein